MERRDPAVPVAVAVWDQIPSASGRAAMPSKAANHTANVVRESWRRALSASPTKAAMIVPSTRQSTMRVAESCAIALRSMGLIGGSLAPFQQLANARQFLGVDTLLFEDVQDQQLMRVAEEAADQAGDFRASCILAEDARGINVRPFISYVLYITLFLKNADDGQNRVVSQRRFSR